MFPPPAPASGGDVKKEAALTFKTASLHSFALYERGVAKQAANIHLKKAFVKW